MVAMLSSSSTSQPPVGDQPASEGPESQANPRPDTPPPQPEPGPMGAQVGNDDDGDDDDDDDDGDGDDGKGVYGTRLPTGIVRPATPALTAMFPRKNPGRDLPPLPQRASASPPGPGTPGKPVPEAQLEEVDPKESPGTPGTPAPADVDTPPPASPPSLSPTAAGERLVELKPEPEQKLDTPVLGAEQGSASPDPTQQSPGTPVPGAENPSGTPVAEAALGDPGQQVGLTPTPPLKPAPGQSRDRNRPAFASWLWDQLDASERSRSEQRPGTPVPEAEQQQQGPGRKFEPDVVDG